jgi:hypothetical protein
VKRFGWLVIVALVLAIPFTLAVMQDEAAISLDIIGVDANELPKVVVNTSVLDAKGQLISGLDVDNFSVGGDLAEIATVSTIENVTDDNLAFASVLIIDTSSSMVGFPLEQTQQAARNYIGALGINDPVAIMSFNTDVYLIQDYTTDKTLLLSAIDNLAFGGKTALYDATLNGIDVANRAPLPRKAVVILSDGGEYGGVSTSTREDSIQASAVQGIPVYTVGLGWNIDRRFLEVISNESNAQFYESPTPDELIDIYNNLAFLFRTQYIVTADVPVAGDGTRYNFTLDVTTSDGKTASGSGVLRAPVPEPILSMPEGLFTAPLVDTTIVTVNVNADDDIASTEYRIGEDVVSTTESYTIEPATTAPGTYTLDISVTDADGDVGTLSADYEIAALPPTVLFDFALEAGEELSEAQTIIVEAGGQTDITGVEFSIDNVVVATDTDAPYEYTLEPFALSPVGHILTITANNGGGQTTSVNSAFAVATLPPQIAVSGLTVDTVLSDTVSANVLAVGQSPITSLSVGSGLEVLASALENDTLDFTLNAVDFAPGTASVDITAMDINGATTTETVSFAVAALPPTIDISGLTADEIITGDVTVTVNGGGQTDITLIDVAYDSETASLIVGNTFTVPTETLGNGDHDVTIVVTNAGGQSANVTIPFVVNLPPTPTFTPPPTDTAEPTNTDEPTDEPTETDTDVPTDEPTETDTDEPTDEPTETDTDVPTDEPTETDTDVPTDEPTVTDTDEPTDEPTVTDTDEPTETNTDVPSPTSNATETAVASAKIEEQATEDALATTNAESTQAIRDERVTAVAQRTVDAQATEDGESTQAAENVLMTVDARSTQQIVDKTSTASAIEEATANAEETASDIETTEAEEAANALATTEAEEAANALATIEAEEAANVLATSESDEATEASANIDASEEAVIEDTDEPTDEPSDVPPTSTDLPTEDSVEDPTAQATLTPVTIVEVDAQSADPQDTSDNSTAVVAVGAGLLLLLLLFLGLRRRGQ